MSLNFQLHPSGKLTVSDETKTTSKQINSSHVLSQINQTRFSATEKTIWDSSDILGNINWSLGAPDRFCDVSSGVFNGLYFKMKFEINYVKLHFGKTSNASGIHVTLLWSKYSVQMNILPVHKLYFAHFLLYNQQHKQKLLKTWQQTFQTLRS